MRPLLRRAVKHCICFILYYSGLLSLHAFLRIKLLKKTDFTILTYHRILLAMSDEHDKPQPGMVTLARTFGEQLKFLTETYDVISIDDLVLHLRSGRRYPKRCIVITFDDGWKDNYTHAFPLLRLYGVPATVFLATDYIESDKMFWFHTVNSIVRKRLLTSEKLKSILDECGAIDQADKTILLSTINQPDRFIEQIKKFDPAALSEISDRINDAVGVDGGKVTGEQWVLNWDEINEMRKHRISFGSHTCSHTILTRMQGDQITRELQSSKRIIEENTGSQVTSFVYPNGDFNLQVKDLVEKAGYLCACTGSRPNPPRSKIDPFALPRLGMHEGTCMGIGGRFSKAIFACYVAGLFVRLRR